MEGVMMGENDVLISKRVNKDQKDTSLMVKQGEHGIVDQVMTSTTLEGERLVRIRMRSQRIPEMGDKFA
ncbi:MAG: hypothetical protein EOP45_11025 [Sphingobacteriaceae bacterium]|nr:MAG: hypothetical protein EOP45_11025 [Sphingobacteriaceae bacterium]